MKDLNNITKSLKKIHLTDGERLSARTKLIQFMEDNPFSEKSSFFARFYILTRRPLWASATAAVLLVAFTGTATYASESALPGDLLYSFKVNVVEEMQGAFQFTEEAKAAWDAERLERRFEEIKALKDLDKLSPEMKLKIKEKMEEHEEAFEDHLEELKSKGKPESADEIELKFKSTFEEKQKLQDEWKPDFEFSPSPKEKPDFFEEKPFPLKEETTETDAQDEIIEEDVIETEAETETEIE